MTSEPRLRSSPFPDSWIPVVWEGHGEGKMGSVSLKSGMGAEGRDRGSVVTSIPGIGVQGLC